MLEASILSTCNRLEIYTLVRNPELGISAVREFLSGHSGLETRDLKPHLFAYHHEDAVAHLLRVAAGLDRLVLGEGQILSQVKKMMRLGQEHKSLGPILNRLLTQAVSTGKRVRSETNLGTGAVSISSAAVELAQLKLGQTRGLDELVTLEDEQVAVVGAGRMSRLLLQHLQAKGASGVVLLNRTVARAEALAADFPSLPVQCRPLKDLDLCLSTCSLVFTSTAADDPIIDAQRLSTLNRRSLLRLIDIGVPRNIAADVVGLGGVEAHDVDRVIRLEPELDEGLGHRLDVLEVLGVGPLDPLVVPLHSHRQTFGIPLHCVVQHGPDLPRGEQSYILNYWFRESLC